MLNIVFPSLPYQRALDPMWQEEHDVARQHGYVTCLFDVEQAKLYAQPDLRHPTLYRGWMLTAAEYEQLGTLTPLLVPMAEYLASHRADGWYLKIVGFTPNSRFVASADARAAVQQLLAGDGKCFVKGLSKSFGSDSIITSLADFDNLLRNHPLEAAEVLLVREHVDLSSQPEQRFFVVHGRPFGAARQPFPELLKPVLAALQNRWFCTVDVAFDRHGQPLVIEVGDGQVSDTKEWSAAELYATAISHLAAIVKSP